MGKFLKYVVAGALLFVALGTVAQEKMQAYYNAHVAFSEGNYDRAAELCKWHYIIIGDNRADELRDKAELCTKLTFEMNTLLAAGQNDDIREKVRAYSSLAYELYRSSEKVGWGYHRREQGLAVRPVTE